jgi:hypothetical protein
MSEVSMWTTSAVAMFALRQASTVRLKILRKRSAPHRWRISCQAAVVGKRLMQGVADEPADGDVDVRLAQELAVVPGKHQSHGNFWIDSRPAIAMAIAIGDFLP